MAETSPRLAMARRRAIFFLGPLLLDVPGLGPRYPCAGHCVSPSKSSPLRTPLHVHLVASLRARSNHYSQQPQPMGSTSLHPIRGGGAQALDSSGLQPCSCIQGIVQMIQVHRATVCLVSRAHGLRAPRPFQTAILPAHVENNPRVARCSLAVRRTEIRATRCP